MEGLSLEEKIGQMLVVGFHGTEAPPHIIDWLKEGRIGGEIKFERNITTPKQELLQLPTEKGSEARFILH